MSSSGAHSIRRSAQPRRAQLDANVEEKTEQELELESALFGTKKRKRVGVASRDVRTSEAAKSKHLKGKGGAQRGIESEDQDEDDAELYDRGTGLDGFFLDVGGMPGVTVGSGSDHEDVESGDAAGAGFYLDAGSSARSKRGVEEEDEGEASLSDSASEQSSDDEDHDSQFSGDSDSDSETASNASSASNPHANSTFTSLASPSRGSSSGTFLAQLKSNNASSSASGSKPKPPLWVDPSDAALTVSIDSDHRLRRLVRGTKDAIREEVLVGTDEDGEQVLMDRGKRIKGTKVEERLREQFKKMHPEPEWAKRALEERVAGKESSDPARRRPTGTPNAQTLLSDLLSSTTPISSTTLPSSRSKSSPLPKSHLQIRRLPDANASSRTGSATGGQGGGGIVDVAFHPSRGMGAGGSVALGVVGGDRRLRMFSIDGETNPSLLTLHIPSLPLTTAKFHPSGTSIYLAGPRPFFYTYDLRSQRCLRSPRNLFGTGSSSSASAAFSDKNLEKSSFSPDGTMLAIAGRKGAVHIVSWGIGGSAGAGQLIMTLNIGRQGGVKDIMWMQGGREIWVLGEGSAVDVWDVGQRRCVWRWTDEGGFGGTMLRKSQDGDYCAVGSSTGIVNVYNTQDITPTSEADFGDLPLCTPKPIRSLMNLTTAVSTVKFNHDGQMLAIASDKKKDSFKAFHLPTATAFTNWPTSATPLGSITAADFSAGSEYIAIGNSKGKVLLYSVSHYHDR